MFERFTKRARKAVQIAHEAARHRGDPEITEAHLLLGLLDERDGVAGRILVAAGVTPAMVLEAVAATSPRNGLSPDDADALRTLGIDLDEVERHVDEAFGTGALRAAGPQRQGHLPLSADAKRTLEGSLRFAAAFRHRYIGTEHLLLAVAGLEHGPAAQLLAGKGLTVPTARERVLAELRQAS